MSILILILTVLLVFLSLFIVLVVLMQKPRADAGLGTAMGGGMAEATFGAETGNVLTRATIVSAITFFVLAFGLFLLQLYQHKHPQGGAGNELPSFKSEVTPTTTPAPAPVVAPEGTPAIAPAPAPANETPAAPKP